MKHFYVFVFLIFSISSLFGQTPEELIKESEKLLKQNNYKETIEKLNSAKMLIENQYLSQIKNDLLPEKLNDYVLTNESNEMTQSYISGNRLQLNKTYIKASENTESQNSMDVEQNESVISITISNIPEKMCEISNIHYIGEIESGYNEAESLKRTKYNEYRAVILFNTDSKQGQFAVLIGGAILEIVAENIDSEKTLKEAADKISIEKIIKYFGK